MKIVEQCPGKLFIGAGSTLVVVGLENTDNAGPTAILKCIEAKDAAIVSLAISSKGDKVFAAFSNKVICCWDITKGEVIGSITMKKRPTAVVHSLYQQSSSGENVGRQCLFVSDKAGDIYALDTELSKCVCVGGHTASIITDMAIHNDIVATADRDEKIRVSRVPNTETIQSYLMGHRNVVCSIGFVKMRDDSSCLVSVGWDHVLCLWDPLTGSALSSYTFQQTRSSISERTATCSAVADAAARVIAGADEEQDEPAEKQYSETDAGHYPFKVCCMPVGSEPVVGVIFKGLRKLVLFTISESGADGYSFVQRASLVLPDVPVDAIISDNGVLFVVLPAPQYLKAFQLELLSRDAGAALEGYLRCSEITSSAPLDECRKTCAALGVTLSQQLAASSVTGDGEEEMKKHVLDAPFAKEIHFRGREKRSGYTFKKGEKRALMAREKAEKEAKKVHSSSS